MRANTDTVSRCGQFKVILNGQQKKGMLCARHKHRKAKNPAQEKFHNPQAGSLVYLPPPIQPNSPRDALHSGGSKKQTNVKKNGAPSVLVFFSSDSNASSHRMGTSSFTVSSLSDSASIESRRLVIEGCSYHTFSPRASVTNSPWSSLTNLPALTCHIKVQQSVSILCAKCCPHACKYQTDAVGCSCLYRGAYLSCCPRSASVSCRK